MAANCNDMTAVPGLTDREKNGRDRPVVYHVYDDFQISNSHYFGCNRNNNGIINCTRISDFFL